MGDAAHIYVNKEAYDGVPMAGMKRFVTYIYAYEEKQKGRNIGFAKIEIRGEECRIEVHLRGLYASTAKCEAFLFQEADGGMEGIRIGEMRLLNGNGDFFVSVRAGGIAGSTLGIYDMEGLLLLGEDEQLYMSRWKEGKPITVCRENFRIWTPQEMSDQTEPESAQKSQDQTAQSQKTQNQMVHSQKIQNQTAQPQKTRSHAEQPQDVPVRAEQPQAASAKKDEVQATEIPMRNIFSEYQWQNVWEDLTKNRMLHHPFEDREAECVQIELKHLRELPRRYWYLGSNSFFLHGFFNYQYLVVGKTGDARWFIGVPGIYQRQERVMAAVFGFPEFLAMASEHNCNEGNREPINQFGCWIRYIEE